MVGHAPDCQEDASFRTDDAPDVWEEANAKVWRDERGAVG